MGYVGYGMIADSPLSNLLSLQAALFRIPSPPFYFAPLCEQTFFEYALLILRLPHCYLLWQHRLNYSIASKSSVTYSIQSTH